MSVAGAVDRGREVAPRTWPEDPVGVGAGVTFEDGTALGDGLGDGLGDELGEALGLWLGAALGGVLGLWLGGVLGLWLGGVLGPGDGQAGTTTLLMMNASENVIRYVAGGTW